MKAEPDTCYALLTLVMILSAFAVLSIACCFIHPVIFCSQYFYFLQQIERGHLRTEIASILAFAMPLVPGTGAGMPSVLAIC